TGPERPEPVVGRSQGGSARAAPLPATFGGRIAPPAPAAQGTDRGRPRSPAGREDDGNPADPPGSDPTRNSVLRPALRPFRPRAASRGARCSPKHPELVRKDGPSAPLGAGRS